MHLMVHCLLVQPFCPSSWQATLQACLGLILSTGMVPLGPKACFIRPKTVCGGRSNATNWLGCTAVLIVIFAEIIPQAFCSRHGLW